MALEYKMPLKLEVQLERIIIHSCTMCNKCFINENDFNNHRRIHTACLKVVSKPIYDHMTSARVIINQLNQCDKCNMVFKNKQEYIWHSIKHVEYKDLNEQVGGDYIKKYKCPECGVKFVAQSTLEAHAIVHEPYAYDCTFCNVGYYQENDLKSHINLVHEAEQREMKALLELEAQKKKEELKKLKLIERESHMNTEPKKLIGPKLSATLDISKRKKSKGKQKYKRRNKESAQSEKKYLTFVRIDGRFHCPICPETCVIKKDMFRHIATLHSNSEHSPCDICNRIYITKDDYESHIDRCMNQEVFACDLCNKVFRVKAHLLLHMKIHQGIKVHCEICNKGFSQSNNLKRHMAVVHNIGDVHKYRCNLCDKEFSCKSFLLRHEIIHSGDRPYKCEFCDKSFSDPSAKNRHIRLHTKETPYSCKYCDKKFTDNSQFYVHTLRHEGNKKYVCKICNYRSYTLSDLKKHTLIHTDIMAYHCDYCGRQFKRKPYVENHIFLMHMKMPMCKKCGRKCYSESEFRRHKKKGCSKKYRVQGTDTIAEE